MNFITGATGLVGMRLMFDLLSNEQDVVALKRINSDLNLVKRVFNFYGNESLFDKIIWKDGDVLDVYSLEDAMKDCRFVYHTAAMVSFHRNDKIVMFDINVTGTANVVNTALVLGVEKMCYISSTAAVGRSIPGETITEESEWKESTLNSSYAVSKYQSELEVWRGIEEGLNAVIVNPSVIIGPGTKGKSSALLFSKKVPFYPVGVNAYVSVEDVSTVCLQLLSSNISNQRYILSSENLDYKTLFSLIANSMNYNPPIRSAQKWMIKVAWVVEGIVEFFTGKKAAVTKETIRSAGNEVFYDSSKIRKELNFSFESVETSIARTGKFYL